MFNAEAYRDQPVIYVKDGAILKELIAHPVRLSDEERSRILHTGMVSFDFLASPVVSARIEQLAMDQLKKTAMDRLESSLGYYQNMGMTCTIVPDPAGKKDTPWLSVSDLNRGASSPPPVGDGSNLVTLYSDWKKAWLARDVAGINAAIKGLNQALPALAPKGIYPTPDQRHAEVTYRRIGLIRWGWICYIVAFFVSIFAVATRYGWVRVVGLILLVAAIGLHGTDLALRWRVIGRIPVANMYEAIVSSTFVGAMFGLVLEFALKRRVFLLSSALLGFFALSLPELLPNVVDNKLSGMMPILDDIMLRIHTVLIISSYAVITLAFGVANCYLFVAAFRQRSPLAQGTIGAQAGALGCLVLAMMGYMDALAVQWFILAFAGMVGGGVFLARGLCGIFLGHRETSPALAAEGFPVRAGVLEEFDLSHRVLLYTATVALFVGLVLGAIWADYSWGRPWGWDPKEVFALNTWLIYAILIHARFVTKQRALWTSVLSVFGFAAMQFNWWVVNFYIVGLHSYA
jgi:ABC-type transport system involved in cytochrome c biogenesis permease subunit